MNKLLYLLLVLPLSGAAACLALPRGQRWARYLSITLTGVTLLIAGALAVLFDPTQAGLQFPGAIPWFPQLGIGLTVGMDGLTLTVVLLTAIVAFSGALLSRGLDRREREFHALYLALTGGAFGAFVTTNLFFFYFFAEFEVLCSYLLVAGWSRRPGHEVKRAAMQMSLFVAAGAVVTLLAFMVLGNWGRTFDLANLQDLAKWHPLPFPVQRILFLMLVGGFGVLLSVWPLHVWAPPAYVVAPTPVSMLSAGVMKQLGAYGLVRIALPLLPDAARWATPLLAVLAVVNILYGGILAWRQREWKALISYATISHAGYILLGLAAMNTTAMTGVVLMLYASGVGTALLFALAGYLEDQGGGDEIARYSGLARRAPVLGGLIVLGTLAASGLPAFAGFVSELSVLAGAWRDCSVVVRMAVAAGLFGLVLTATYMLQAVRQGVFGPPAEPVMKVLDLQPFRERLPYLLLLLTLLVPGLFPRLLSDGIARGLSTLIGGLP